MKPTKRRRAEESRFLKNAKEAKTRRRDRTLRRQARKTEKLNENRGASPPSRLEEGHRTKKIQFRPVNPRKIQQQANKQKQAPPAGKQNKPKHAKSSKEQTEQKTTRQGNRAGRLSCCGRRPERCICWHITKAPADNNNIMLMLKKRESTK